MTAPSSASAPLAPLASGAGEGLPALLIEAFSAVPFAGNGAAVVALGQPCGADWLQALARSLRQSETAFLLPSREGWMLRWFTPTCEVPLCGHATLAALLALGHWGHLGQGEEIRLHSRSGPLAGTLVPGEGAERSGMIQLPAWDLHPAAIPERLDQLLRHHLGFPATAFWHSELGYSVGLVPAEARLAAMPSLADALQGDLRKGLVLMQPPPPGQSLPAVRGEPADYQLRFFAPGLGIDEDPVTGSAHALVAPWWQRQLGRRTVRGWQCSDRPGGMVCEGTGSAMIRLFGAGHLLWEGTIWTGSPSSGTGWPAPSASGCLGLESDWNGWRTATRLPSSAPCDGTPS